MVSAGPPAYIVVGAQNCNVDYWDDVAEFNDIVAVVSDVYHNPVNDSTVVYFTTDEGTMKSHEERTKDLEGIATTRWISGNNVPTCDGDVLVIAETAGGTVIDTSMFFNTHFPDTLIVTGVPSAIPANSKSEVYIWVTGLDLNDNPVIGGTKFLADATYLKVAGGSLEDGCYSASDRVVLQSAVLEQDYSLTGGDDDGIGAVDVVTYWHPGGAASSFSVIMTTGTTYSGNSSMSVQGSPKGGDIAYFTIVIKDRAGNPLGDHTMDLGSGTVETNTYGEAYFSAQIPLVPGDYTYTATDTDPRGNGVVLSTTVSVEDE
jgi:hypothetical protein